MLQVIAQVAAAPVDELVDVELPDPDVELPDPEDPFEEPPGPELAGVEDGVVDEPESLDDADELAESPEAVLVALELLEAEPPRLSVL